jgi:hypothetical protein
LEIITQGYSRKCKDSIGGLNEVYLFPFVKYSRSQIITNGINLVTFPNTLIYRYHFLGDTGFNESTEVDAGGKLFNQTISLTFQSSNDFVEMQKLLKQDYRIIIKDKNGNYRILGLFNGCIANDLRYTTGSGKSDLNGFTISFEAKEEKTAHFINDLENAGFEVFTGDDFLLLEDGFYLLFEDGGKIIIQ